MAIEQCNSNDGCTLEKLGNVYKKQCKFDLATKYYIRALYYYPVLIYKICEMIPILSHETQLEILDCIPLIRTDDEYFHKISCSVHNLFMKKQIKICQYLSYYLIRELVDICLAYY